MKKKNRAVRAAICIGVAVLVLTMAVFANYDNANGYSTIKTALKNVMFSDNYTLNADLSIDIDGISLASMEDQYLSDRNGDVKAQSVFTFTYADGSYSTEMHTVQDGYSFRSFDETSYSTKYKIPFEYDGSLVANTNNEVFTKGVNFIETLSDTLIGDIKNNIILSQTDGNNRTYNLNMTGEQLPKYMTAAFSFFCAGMRSSNTNIISHTDGEVSQVAEAERLIDSIFRNSTEPYINSINGNVTVDDHDRITAFDGRLVITGYDESDNARNIGFNINMTVGDFDTTTIERVNADEYEDIYNSSSYIVTESEDDDIYENEDGGYEINYDGNSVTITKDEITE